MRIRKLKHLIKQAIKIKKMYSQNNEQQIILNHFGEFKGHLLDLGANDGETFSNSLKAIQKGWSADLIEASPETFKRLQTLHNGNDNVKCHNVAVSNIDGKIRFYESGTLLGGNDKSLVSTCNPNELKRWPDVQFTEISVDSLTFAGLLNQTKSTKFDLITIDIEGVDWLVLNQMNLNDLGCKMIIVETNGVETLKYVNYCKQFGFQTLSTNAENLIMVNNG